MDILLICDRQSFCGEDFHQQGVGGTPAAMIVLAEELARQNHRVTIANRRSDRVCQRQVHYVPIADVQNSAWDRVILVKLWSEVADSIHAQQRLFFWTDVHLNPDSQIGRCFRWASQILLMSDYQHQRLLREMPTARTLPLRVVGLPVRLEDYCAGSSPRDNVLIYCSVPDRGLYYLKSIFPVIRRQVPDAQLVITSDFTLWGMESAQSGFAQFFQNQSGILYLGAIPRPELVQWQLKAKVMTYPCRFEEGFCLAAAECMAAGAVPVTTQNYALTTTVGQEGVLIPGQPRHWLYQWRFVRSVVKLLQDPAFWQDKSNRCRTTAQQRFCADRLSASILTL